VSTCDWCKGSGQVGPVEDRYECPRCVSVPRAELERLRRIEEAAIAYRDEDFCHMQRRDELRAALSGAPAPSGISPEVAIAVVNGHLGIGAVRTHRGDEVKCVAFLEGDPSKTYFDAKDCAELSEAFGILADALRGTP
jgi:hypothetical protein